MTIRNVFTVDVEDYFMVSAFSNVVRPDQWDRFESRVERNTLRLLDLLGGCGVTATFFVVGFVAEKYPGLVREIHRRGHEIGCHSHRHRLIYTMTPDEFRDDTQRAKSVLEDITGERLLGYRAPSCSITAKSLWALDILAEEGFRYDSSIFPIRHDRYGYPEFGRFPRHVGANGGKGVFEMPLSTIRLLGTNLPIAGGGYLRLYPVRFTEWAIRRVNDKEKAAVIVYVHPWEVDPGQPRLQGKALSVFRHYVNISRTEKRLLRLLGTFPFGPARDAVGTDSQES